MTWLRVLESLVGPAIQAAQVIAGDRWDPTKAEAVTRALVRRPPRQAIADADRERLRALGERETEPE